MVLYSDPNIKSRSTKRRGGYVEPNRSLTRSSTQPINRKTISLAYGQITAMRISKRGTESIYNRSRSVARDEKYYDYLSFSYFKNGKPYFDNLEVTNTEFSRMHARSCRNCYR